MVDSRSNGIFITYGTSSPNGPLKHNIMGGYSLPVIQIKTYTNPYITLNIVKLSEINQN